MAHALFILQSAFSFWLLFDAVEHRRESYWFLVVLLPFVELVYASYLMEDGRNEAARTQIETALDDYQHSPPYQRRRDAAWARQARKMLKNV